MKHYFKLIIFFSTLLIEFWFINCQKVAPLLPSEYAANVVQRKWNHNGFVVNNTYSQTTYSSYSQKMWRTDTVTFSYCSDDHSQPGPLNSLSASSLLDFTLYPPQNTYLTVFSISDPVLCVNGSAVGFPAPPPPNILQLIHAIYAGIEFDREFGKCEKWTVISGNTVVTFFFTVDNKQFVRYDFVVTDDQARQGEVGVVTYYYNMFQGTIPSHIFSGSNACPDYTVTSFTPPQCIKSNQNTQTKKSITKDIFDEFFIKYPNIPFIPYYYFLKY
eukprot:TRINITY_DN4340_c0_g1_i1.p1 TRINITY_DN4340_c0_g1~~TRINITY_DN4340_c0_g1_i1.p1  ORF type:complete len:273 (+),score=82.59 TRINITY_DN4340_c0_g1_i1:115-933(+)